MDRHTGHLFNLFPHSTQQARWPHGTNTTQTSSLWQLLHFLESTSCFSSVAVEEDGSSGASSSVLVVLFSSSWSFSSSSWRNRASTILSKLENPILFDSYWLQNNNASLKCFKRKIELLKVITPVVSAQLHVCGHIIWLNYALTYLPHAWKRSIRDKQEICTQTSVSTHSCFLHFVLLKGYCTLIFELQHEIYKK